MLPIQRQGTNTSRNRHQEKDSMIYFLSIFVSRWPRRFGSGAQNRSCTSTCPLTPNTLKKAPHASVPAKAKVRINIYIYRERDRYR